MHPRSKVYHMPNSCSAPKTNFLSTTLPSSSKTSTQTAGCIPDQKSITCWTNYVLLRKRDRQDIRITRVMRGVEYWSDHLMVRSILEFAHLQEDVQPRRSWIVLAWQSKRTEPTWQRQLQATFCRMHQHRRAPIIGWKIRGDTSPRA